MTSYQDSKLTKVLKEMLASELISAEESLLILSSVLTVQNMLKELPNSQDTFSKFKALTTPTPKSVLESETFVDR